MNRRVFVALSSSAALGALARRFAAAPPEDLTAGALSEYLRGLLDVPKPSVDRVVLGDPDAPVTKIGTCWLPYWSTLRAAAEAGVSTMVVHEPTFYTHWDLDETEADYHSAPPAAKTAYTEAVTEKRAWIEDNGLTIIRCHDVIDRLPEIGVPYAFAQALGFSDAQRVVEDGYHHVYQIEPQPALVVTRRLAAQMKKLNQDGVAFYGDPERRVETVGIGTGYASDPMQYMDLSPDLFVAIADPIRTWIQTVYAEDTGHPLVVVDHGTSEESAMKLLADLLREAFPGVAVQHFAQGCGYRWIS